MKHPIMLEFVIGAAAAAICQTGVIFPTRVLFVGAAAWFFYGVVNFYPTIPLNEFRAYGFGPPAAMLLCGVMMLERDDRLKVPALIIFAGNASYSTYLWQIGLLGMLSKFWPWTVGIGSVRFVIVALAFTALVSAVSYQFIERPLISMSQRRRTEPPD